MGCASSDIRENNSQEPNSVKRNLVITGANKGIGYATVERLVAENAQFDIIATSRNVELGEKAAREIRNKYPNFKNDLIYRQLDVDDEKSVNVFVDWVKNKYGKLDVLVNNAGVLYENPTVDQQIKTIKTNFFSVVTLTEKFLPLLTKDGKIVNVSSIVGSLSWQGPTLRKAIENERITEKQLFNIAHNIIEETKDYPKEALISDPSYPASKALLNTYIRRFLVAKLKDNQQCYSLHPGVVQTDMAAGLEGKIKLITPYEGADTSVYLINLPFVKNSEFNGKFFDNRKVVVY